MAEERDMSGSSKATEHRLDVVLRLNGLHPDGEHLVLVGPTGARYVVKVDEALRAAVRRDRPHLEQIQAEGELSPREIQIRVRAGESAAQIAESSGLHIEHVRKYEGPVVAERVYMATQARKARVGRTTDAPELGDLVTDRLAARGVDITGLEWDASRRGTNGWVVSATFIDGEEIRRARWAFTPQGQSVRALEDEARLLSETALIDGPIPQRPFQTVRDQVFDVESVSPLAPPIPATPHSAVQRDKTSALLDDLATRRGVRQPVDLSDDELPTNLRDQDPYDSGSSGNRFTDGSSAGDRTDFEATTPARRNTSQLPARIYSLRPANNTEAIAGAPEPNSAVDSGANPSRSASPSQGQADGGTRLDNGASPDSGALPDSGVRREPHSSFAPKDENLGAVDSGLQHSHDEQANVSPETTKPASTPETPAAKPRAARKGRPQVPSWDEIVFGTKQD